MLLTSAVLLFAGGLGIRSGLESESPATLEVAGAVLLSGVVLLFIWWCA
jgi:hypothetical protein